jgi:DNA-binding CsgD family transcriptional regulator
MTGGAGTPAGGLRLVDYLYLTAMDPARFAQLIEDWDVRLGEVGYGPNTLAALDHSGVRGHVARARDLAQLLSGTDGVSVAETAVRRIETAAFVCSPTGAVLACNAAAAAVFGIAPGARVADLPLALGSRAQFPVSLDAARRGGADHREVLRLTPGDQSRTIIAFLRLLPDQAGRPDVLVVTTEHVWTTGVETALQRAFAVTPAEINVLRQIMSGQSVSGIAAALGRSEATIRSQVHALLAKTGTRSQAELVSLMVTFQTSARDQGAALPVAGSQTPARANPYQTLFLPDGRRLDYLRLGHPQGQGFLWLHGNLSQCRLPKSAEDWLHRLRLSMVVPIRAGYGYSSALPRPADAQQVAVSDIGHLRRHLALPPGPVVAHGNDFMLACTLALAGRAEVTHLFGVGATFPVETPEDFARLGRWARFFRANAHHAPWAVAFLGRSAYRFGRAVGLERYVELVMKGTPDGEAFAVPEIRAAVLAGMEILWGDDVQAQDAFAADTIAVQRGPWPDLARLTVPVTLIHGTKDTNCSFEDAVVHQARHPSWRLMAFVDAGNFVHHAHWPEMLGAIAEAMGIAPV